MIASADKQPQNKKDDDDDDEVKVKEETAGRWRKRYRTCRRKREASWRFRWSPGMWVHALQGRLAGETLQGSLAGRGR